MRNLSIHLVAMNPGRYSLALGYLESNLRSSPELLGRIDIETTRIDLDDPNSTPLDLAELAYRITCFRPRLIGFSVFMWNHAMVSELTRLIASIDPRATLVLGGTQFERLSSIWNDYPDDAVIVMGEGERPLVEIARRLLADEDLEGIPGVALKKNGEWRAEVPAQSHDLEQLSSPILDGSLALPDGDRLPSYAISRGCIYRCCYCTWGDGRGVRFFPMERVERELELLSRSSYERLCFTDCLFGVDEDRYLWLLEKLARWPHRPRFGFETRAEFLTPRLIEGLRKLELDFLAIGIQSLDREVLRNVDRAQNEARVFEALDRLMPAIREKHRIHLELILGLPGDSLDGAFNAVDTLRARYPEASFFIELLKVLPGTPLWETAKQRHWVIQNSEHSHDLVQSESFSIDQVLQLKLLSEGLAFLQRPHIRPHLPKLENGNSYAAFAAATGEYLRRHGYDCQHHFDGSDWLSNRLGLRTRRVLQGILESSALNH